MKNRAFNLPDGLKLGTASAATQIEGGECGHNWNDWYHKGHIKDGSDPANANQHYELWKEDCDLMSRMGLKVYRLGLEWSRIEPTEGQYNEDALKHYRRELLYLKVNGISPLLTLHHFTNPMWFEDKGGFSRKENSVYFLRFVKKCLTSFSDLVSEYITINEPNIYATSSWFFGEFPPGGHSFKKALTVMSVMAHCHIEAYRMIHSFRNGRGYTDTKVSFANHLRVFQPQNIWNPWHRICTGLVRWFFQDALTQAMCTGKFSFPLINWFHHKKGKYLDFIGVNYYSRSTISGFADGVKKGVSVNDLGWEIYPQGIVRCIKPLYERYRLPIYITENGTCDNNDSFRSRYIYEHLKALAASGLPVKRYYHWCFCDNFEWLEGESARFGIVRIDYKTQERTIKESGYFYSEIVTHNGVTEEMFSQYVKKQRYPNNAEAKD